MGFLEMGLEPQNAVDALRLQSERIPFGDETEIHTQRVHCLRLLGPDSAPSVVRNDTESITVEIHSTLLEGRL